jgi:hypothetical protein
VLGTPDWKTQNGGFEMLRDSVATESICSFLPTGQQADVPPLEEPIFVLTGSQLQAIIQQAVKPLQDRIAALENWREDQAEIVAQLTRITRKEAQPMQKDRGEILRALLAANDGKMLAKEARQKMRMSRQLFSMLLAIMKEEIEVRPYQLKRNQKLLVLR